MNSKKGKVAFEERPEDVDDDQEEEFEEEEFEEEEDDEEEEGDMDFDLEAMDETLASYLTTEDGDNVATALMNISDNVQNLTKAIETQNKILVKIATQMSKKSS